MVARKALITGITGQDGSYLAELLLSKGYEVHGLVRRVALEAPEQRFWRLRGILDRLHLHPGSLESYASVLAVVEKVQPDELYHLAAQSFISESFEDAFSTFNTNVNGTLHVLSALKERSPKTRFYFAATSEMFGKAPAPQNEETRFHPRSPYGISKVAGFELTRNFREGYGLFACSGILFNHECVTAETPVIIRNGGIINVLPIEEVVPHRASPYGEGGKRYTTEPAQPTEVWDRDRWTKINLMTATWSDGKDVMHIRARGASFSVTPDHVVFADGGKEKKAGRLSEQALLDLCQLPPPSNMTESTKEEAWLLGVIVADGWIHREGIQGRVVNNDEDLLHKVAAIWEKITGGIVTFAYGVSGFNPSKHVGQANLHGDCGYLRWLRPQIYTESAMKRVPIRVLNASVEVQKSFLEGYNICDGLKKGYGTHTFKSFKTNSPTLAAGLWWMAKNVLSQRTILCIENRGDAVYYQINLNTPGTPKKGQSRKLPLEQIVGIERKPYKGWLFDFATDSGTFHAGVGQGWIHNSPRRGFEFVTRKITAAAARIACGSGEILKLGNLDAQRDWGFAGDYVDAMWRMLQQDVPDDYVIATGTSHTVRYFLDRAFHHAGLDWKKHVEIDPQFLRPAEVDLLCGDATKAWEKLCWRPTVGFEELVNMMVDNDLELQKARRR